MTAAGCVVSPNLAMPLEGATTAAALFREVSRSTTVETSDVAPIMGGTHPGEAGMVGDGLAGTV